MCEGVWGDAFNDVHAKIQIVIFKKTVSHKMRENTDRERERRCARVGIAVQDRTWVSRV